jgi:hypothetical protein
MWSLISAFDLYCVLLTEYIYVDQPDTLEVKVGHTLEIVGLTLELFSTGLEFLKRYNHAAIKDQAGDVIIIGGGLPAVASARSCA